MTERCGRWEEHWNGDAGRRRGVWGKGGRETKRKGTRRICPTFLSRLVRVCPFLFGARSLILAGFLEFPRSTPNALLLRAGQAAKFSLL